MNMKMLVMLPVMFAARKIDAEDPFVVYWLRVAYAVIQVACVMVIAYTYIQAMSMAGKTKTIYVPPPPQPFADPNAKTKYTETAFGAHVISQARSLLGSTLFGIALTVGLHYYKGMITGVAIQTIMAPLNLIENPLVKALLLGNGIREEDKIFNEKTASELTADDEVVDDKGNPVVRNLANSSANSIGGDGGDSSTDFESVLLDTWDAGVKADLSNLMANVTKKNCNFQTKEDHWTPLMVLSGLCVPGSASAIRQVKQLGGNPAILDKEGWNALHWAAFHGNVEAAKEHRKETKLLAVKDKEGNTPIETARKEGNESVAKVFEEAMGESKKSK
mmetsp:Transcript_3381/g.7069  ORF Transcript_3381/g.7069 Transcript_3381/m.7069 type:complete len:333 (+) Transcript_3381:217-1215(+)|eukprot:CAMPEP_0168753656 /NCGR_PEP_ID=MMETSP0724-20121128/19062_1 /TAXON_ID=265536 /ORGANISM="Amphiprora sp., Strain CCMP467" /LENGTH=332 /DNA_ID=CAMNT_0008802039 /DNA_START=159 /DNA_END=1157 /DNA_ORIENTATION=+